MGLRRVGAARQRGVKKSVAKRPASAAAKQKSAPARRPVTWTTLEVRVLLRLPYKWTSQQGVFGAVYWLRAAQMEKESDYHAARAKEYALLRAVDEEMWAALWTLSLTG